MPKPDCQSVPCLHCTRGPKGRKDCSGGMRVRTLTGGSCFLGAYLPDKAPQAITVYSPTGGHPRSVKVVQVEAPSYADAGQIASDAGHEQWVWVKDGVPGESR